MGAFEDRLAAGYRQAANTPAKKPQPTTPTEALAEAIHPGHPGSRSPWCITDAVAILAALPPGWHLVGPDDHQTADLITALDDIYNVQSVGDLDLFIKQARQDAAAAERRRLLEVHMADHDDATGWCPTCALLTDDER